MQPAEQKTNPFLMKQKLDSNVWYFAGIDLHKKFMQVAFLDAEGTVCYERRIECDHDIVRQTFSFFPKDTKYVMESSSVWCAMYRLLSDELKLDVILSNPYKIRIIAESKKKTDKVDARILADLLRGNYIAPCHIPDDDTIQKKQLVRFRARMVQETTRFKNMIHGILLQNGITIKGSPFFGSFRKNLRKLDDWRINEHLGNLEHIEQSTKHANIKISQCVKQDKNAQLLITIPGIGDYTTLAISCMIDDII